MKFSVHVPAWLLGHILALAVAGWRRNADSWASPAVSLAGLPMGDDWSGRGGRLPHPQLRHLEGVQVDAAGMARPEMIDASEDGRAAEGRRRVLANVAMALFGDGWNATACRGGDRQSADWAIFERGGRPPQTPGLDDDWARTLRSVVSAVEVGVLDRLTASGLVAATPCVCGCGMSSYAAPDEPDPAEIAIRRRLCEAVEEADEPDPAEIERVETGEIMPLVLEAGGAVMISERSFSAPDAHTTNPDDVRPFGWLRATRERAVAVESMIGHSLGRYHRLDVEAMLSGLTWISEHRPGVFARLFARLATDWEGEKLLIRTSDCNFGVTRELADSPSPRWLPTPASKPHNVPDIKPGVYPAPFLSEVTVTDEAMADADLIIQAAIFGEIRHV